MAGLMAAAPAQAASAGSAMSGANWFSSRLGDSWPGTATPSPAPVASGLNVNNSTSVPRVTPTPSADAGANNAAAPIASEAAPVVDTTAQTSARQMSWGDDLEAKLPAAELNKITKDDMKWGADDEKALQFSKLDKEMKAAKESFKEMTPKQQESVMKLLSEKGSKKDTFDSQVRKQLMKSISKKDLEKMTPAQKKAYQDKWLSFYGSDF